MKVTPAKWPGGPAGGYSLRSAIRPSTFGRSHQVWQNAVSLW